MVISQIQFKRLQAVNSADFDSVLTLYQASFPAHERLPIDVFITRIEKNLDELIVGYFQGEIVLMATLCLLSHTCGLVLVYLATSPLFQSQGAGTLFFHNLSQRLQQHNQTLFLEVEEPEIGNLETRKIRQRRYQFYRRLGAKTLRGVTYFVPSQTEEPAEQMRLMVWQYPDIKMEGKFVQKIIQKMYQEIYNRPQDDPLLIKIIQEIPNQIELF